MLVGHNSQGRPMPSCTVVEENDFEGECNTAWKKGPIYLHNQPLGLDDDDMIMIGSSIYISAHQVTFRVPDVVSVVWRGGGETPLGVKYIQRSSVRGEYYTTDRDKPRNLREPFR